jgi:HEAT repeat protein
VGLQPELVQCVLTRDLDLGVAETVTQKANGRVRIQVVAVNGESFENGRRAATANGGTFRVVDPANLAIEPAAVARLREVADRPADAANTVLPDESTPPVESSVADWVAQLKSPLPTKRAQAAFALARLGREAKSAVPALREALRDSDPNVHAAVEFALKRIPN